MANTKKKKKNTTVWMYDDLVFSKEFTHQYLDPNKYGQWEPVPVRIEGGEEPYQVLTNTRDLSEWLDQHAIYW